MKNTIRPLWRVGAAVLVLVGCQGLPPSKDRTADMSAAQDPPCLVTVEAYLHVYDRHCAEGGEDNRFLADYCTREGMQAFCGMVQNAPRRTRTVQPDGRIRYDGNLDQVVGMAGEKCGRLVIAGSHDGSLVTQFPELGGAPPPCR